MNKEIINKAFEGITPSDELVKKVLSAEFDCLKSTKSIKRTFAVVIAACAVLLFGISAAAVERFIGFKEIFGKYIDLENEELGEVFIAQASDIVFTVSDDDYRIDVKGITGGNDSVYAIIEISREDGTPVSECFSNPISDENDICWMWEDFAPIACSGGRQLKINSAGNIENIIDLKSETGLLNGCTISVSGENLAAGSNFFGYCDAENAVYGYRNDYDGVYKKGWWRDPFRGMSKDEQLRCEKEQLDKYGIAPIFDFISGEEAAQIDTSDFMLLPLEWEISFRYSASPVSSKTLKSKKTKERTVYYEKNREHNAAVSEIRINAAGGTVVFEYEDSLVPANYESAVSDAENKISFIASNGVCVPMQISSTSSKMESSKDGKTQIVTVIAKLVFAGNSSDTIKYVDVQGGTAVCINGKTYELV